MPTNERRRRQNPQQLPEGERTKDQWTSSVDETYVHADFNRITPSRKTPRSVSRRESRSLSELTRQITPPTKNGHAPPSTKSSKSSQSDLPIRCSGLVRFPVLSQIKPQAPRLVVPFRQFLQVSALLPYSPRNRSALTSRSERLPIRCRLSRHITR